MRALFLFGKDERVRFVSHLDLQRFMQRAFNRTNLPIAFSNGFNPHPVMSFASALAMGWTSEYEIFDIKLTRDIDREFALAEMRRALPPGLPVIDVALVDDKHPKMMASLTLADYRVTLPEASVEAIAAQVPGFMAEESVMAVRKTKSGEKLTDIRPMAISIKRDGDALLMRLSANETSTLKPDLVISVLAERAGIDAPEARIHRTALLGNDSNGEIVPLLALKG